MMATCSTSVKSLIPMANKYDRVVLLVDMDCFYCQVEEKLNPSLKNQPLAVVQYNAWRGGGIIAVNYAARAKGVTRHMRGDEAKEQCPEIQLVKVPNVREKADLSKYREAGKEVANVLQRFTPLLERASVDEAYLDITDAVNKRLQEMNDGTFILQPEELLNTYAVGYPTIGEFVTTITSSFIMNPLLDDDNFYQNFDENDVPAVRQSNIRLLIGASIASEIRSAVKTETSYECSAGIAHNKILAKLACGINKPNKQTLLPLAQIPGFFETLPVGKIKGLGAKFGEEICERLNIRYLGQLLKFTEAELQRKFDEKNGTWLYNISRGIDLEAVTPRFYSKSIGCCKKFPGRNNITGLKTLQHWLNELANEINERLEKDIYENNRRAKQMVVSFIQEFDGEEVSSSRSAHLQSYDIEMLARTSLEIIRSNTKQFFRPGSESVLNNPIKFLGISVGKFETISNSQNNIQEMFAQQAAKKEKFKSDLKTKKQKLSLINLSEDKLKSDLKTNIQFPDNSMNQIPMEENDKYAKRFLLKATNSQIHLITEGEYKSANDLLKQNPKEKNSPKIKSFFLKALRKEPPNENNKILVNENYNGEIGIENVIHDKPESKSINQVELNSIPGNELISTENITSKAPPTSFFARVLQRKEEDLTYETGHSNVNHKPETNNKNEENGNADIVATAINGPITKKRKCEDISDTKELNQSDYRSQYAEFAVPEFRTEFLQFTNCSKCGAKTLNDPIYIQTHQDYHYAQELSQQQRHEYRDKIRSQIISPKSNNLSNKKSKKFNNVPNRASTDITKFLKPSSASMTCTENPESSSSIIEVCDICKLTIKTEEILEHKDFHMAKDLQKKLNQLEVRTVEVLKKPASDSSRKSINSSINMSSQQNKVTAKPITKFFTQSNI